MPMLLTGSSFVFETFCVSFLPVGSLAGAKFSPLPAPCRPTELVDVNERIACLEDREAALDSRDRASDIGADIMCIESMES